MVQLLIVMEDNANPLHNPPPHLAPVFCAMTQFVKIAELESHTIPAPASCTVLLIIVQLVMVMDEFDPQYTPPPKFSDEFPLIMPLVMVMDELIQPITPPPHVAEFHVKMQLVRIGNDP